MTDAAIVLLLACCLFTLGESRLSASSSPVRTQASDTSSCQFDHYLGFCTVELSTNHLEIVIFIDHCSTPIDVTFIIRSENPSFDWRYTFLANNPPEHPTLPEGLAGTSLHVELHNSSETDLTLLAEFHTAEESKPFLNATVPILHQDCLVQVAKGANRTAYVVVCLASALIALGLVLLVFVVRKRTTRWRQVQTDQQEADRTVLVTNMESSTALNSPTEKDYKVEYRVPDSSDRTKESTVSLTSSVA